MYTHAHAHTLVDMLCPSPPHRNARSHAHTHTHTHTHTQSILMSVRHRLLCVEAPNAGWREVNLPATVTEKSRIYRNALCLGFVPDDVVPDGSSSSDDQIEAQQRLPAGGASAARDPPSRWPDPPPVEPPLPGNQPEAPDWWGLRGDAHNEDCQPIRGERFRALRFPPHMRIERERLLARERGMREVLRAQTRLVDMASGLLCRGRGEILFQGGDGNRCFSACHVAA